MTGWFLPRGAKGAEGRRVLDDRIEIKSLGILLSGLTIEEVKQGTSRIRNHVIARVFRELHLIEQWGTGVRRIFEEAKALGQPEPKIEEVGMRVRFTIDSAQPHKIVTDDNSVQSIENKSRLESSRIRNHVIARVFRELHLIEQWGTGVRRIFEEAKALGQPEPKIEEVGMRVRFTIDSAQPHKIVTDDNSVQSIENKSRLESRLAARVIALLSEEEMGKAELVERLGHKSISGELNKQIKRLLDMGYIERTIPDKPNSRLQKYRLVEIKQ